MLCNGSFVCDIHPLTYATNVGSAESVLNVKNAVDYVFRELNPGSHSKTAGSNII